MERFIGRYNSKERCSILEEFLKKLLGEDMDGRIEEQRLIKKKAEKEIKKLNNIKDKEMEIVEKKIDRVWEQFKKETGINKQQDNWVQEAWKDDKDSHPWFQRQGIEYTFGQVYIRRMGEINGKVRG